MMEVQIILVKFVMNMLPRILVLEYFTKKMEVWHRRVKLVLKMQLDFILFMWIQMTG